MSRSERMLEILRLLREARAPTTAATLATALEVAPRTIYRDVAALQAMRVPIEGAAGLGYVLGSGYELPPLAFEAEEVEAIVVGLALLGRSGDAGLVAAARTAARKIAAALPPNEAHRIREQPLVASAWHALPETTVDPAVIRRAIREEAALAIAYTDAAGALSRRVVRPIALGYYVDSVVLAAWCELRDDLRHFRIDRITACERTGARFRGEGARLRKLWRETRTHMP